MDMNLTTRIRVGPPKVDGRYRYLAFTPNHCSHCGADFNAHIPSGELHVYFCPEWALRQKWGDR